MTRAELVKLRYAYPGRPKAAPAWAIKQLDQVFEPGGAYALLGPAGAGKTTLLRLITGLIAPSEGRILFGEEDVTDKRAEERNIAHVFDAPAVYATMTVRENIAFPLRNRRLAPAEARRRVDEALDLLGLTPKSVGSVRQLSAEEQQKVAIGRALVRGPAALMALDDPLLPIEPTIRWRLLAELKALHRRIGATTIFATSDQSQALSFGDRVLVMSEGEVLQVGSAAELFDRPRHTFVGRFIGSPGMNILPVNVEGAKATLSRSGAGGAVIELPSAPNLEGVETLELGVRPEHVRVGLDGMAAQVMRVENAGRLRIVRARIEGFDIAAVVQEGAEIPADARISFDPRNVHLYADSWRIELGVTP